MKIFGILVVAASVQSVRGQDASGSSSDSTDSMGSSSESSWEGGDFPTPAPTPAFSCGRASGLLDDGAAPTFNFVNCQNGEGNFQLCLDVEEESVTVGEIPAGLIGLRIDLNAATDLDIRIYDISDNIVATKPGGQAVVAWCENGPEEVCGGALLGLSPFEDTATYAGMQITYSGYGSDLDSMGKEYIIIAGESTVPLRMEAYAYETGSVDVTYSWTDTNSACCAGTAACTGTFTRDVPEDAVLSIGDIPTGVKDLKITLEAENDLDIQLFDKVAGKRIVAFDLDNLDETGLGNQPLGPVTANYPAGGDITYTYSGYLGDFMNEKAGNEEISITGSTDRALEFKVFGYEAGECKVSYEYFTVV